MKPVNLNQFRKQKARTDKTARANENAKKFGRSKTDKKRDTLDVASLEKHLDAHKIDREEP